MKNKLSLIGIIILLLTLFSCPQQPPTQPETPIFSDLEKIKIWQSGDPITQSEGTFFYELADSIKYTVIYVFNEDPVIYDSAKTFSTDHLVAGSRTGLDSFDRGSIAVQFLSPVILPDKEDFDPDNFFNPGGTAEYYWFVLGFNGNGILTHASPKYHVSINWDS